MSVEKSDAQLIELFREERDEKALHELISRYDKRVYAFAFRLVRSQEEAEDISQEVFIKAWKHIHRYDPRRDFGTWVLTITYRTAIDWLRKKKATPFSFFTSRTDEKIPYEETIADTDPLPDVVAESREKKEVLEKALGKVEENDRLIILLHHTEGLSFEEISSIIHKPMNTVKSRYRRALIRLREELSLHAPEL